MKKKTFRMLIWFAVLALLFTGCAISAVEALQPLKDEKSADVKNLETQNLPQGGETDLVPGAALKVHFSM